MYAPLRGLRRSARQSHAAISGRVLTALVTASMTSDRNASGSGKTEKSLFVGSNSIRTEGLRSTVTLRWFEVEHDYRLVAPAQSGFSPNAANSCSDVNGFSRNVLPGTPKVVT